MPTPPEPPPPPSSPILFAVLQDLPQVRHSAVRLRRRVLARQVAERDKRPHLRVLRRARLLRRRHRAGVHAGEEVPELLAEGEQGLRLLRIHRLLRLDSDTASFWRAPRAAASANTQSGRAAMY